MKKKILAGLLVAGTAAVAAPRFSVGVGFGAPAPVYTSPSQYVDSVPPCPGPGYAFIDGYWQYVGTPVIVHDDDDDFRGPVVRVDRDHVDRDRGDRGNRWDRDDRGRGEHADRDYFRR